MLLLTKTFKIKTKIKYNQTNSMINIDELLN